MEQPSADVGRYVRGRLSGEPGWSPARPELPGQALRAD
jgi:hypothetical protein